MKPKVMVLADVEGWAWETKAKQYARHLGSVDGDFVVTVGYHSSMPDPMQYDLVHLFEVSQINHIPEEYRLERGVLIAGLTANVWRTWGEERMKAWSSKVDALHGNSLLICRDLVQFHSNVFYTPNGVDVEYWKRTKPYPDSLVACHIGKPNPRKGGSLIVEACDALGIELLLVQRTAKIRLQPEEIREIYSSSSIQITMSDMDGTLVSTRIGNMPEFIEEERNGWLVDRDAESLRKVLSWCRNHHSQVKRIGSEARETAVREWRWDQQVKKVSHMWHSMLEKREKRNVTSDIA
jgi:glycosyltransferase involved in cell wall biosynthesis